MAADKRSSPMLAIMMAKAKKGRDAPEDDEPAEPEDDMDLGSEGLHSAMQDLLDAVQKSDPAAMAEAFKDAVSLAGDDGEPEDKEDDEDKPLGMTIRR